MKFIFNTLFLFAVLFSGKTFANNSIWLPLNSAQVEATLAADFNVSASSSWSFDLSQMTNLLNTAGNNPNNAISISLPYPDGSFHTYKVWESSIMEAGLAAKFPQIKKVEGQIFIDWLISKEGQDTIASFKVGNEQLFFPNAKK